MKAKLKTNVKAKAKAKTLLAPKSALKVSIVPQLQKFNLNSKDLVVAKQLPKPRLLCPKAKAPKVCNASLIASMTPATPEKYGPGNCMADKQPLTPPDGDEVSYNDAY